MKILKKPLKNIKFLFLLISIFYFSFSVFLVLAQTAAAPQFLISWQAENYAPSWYRGKILPINRTPVEISFELIDNSRLADLSKTIVRWYVNDDLIRNENDGLGIKSLRIMTPNHGGGEIEIRIAVVDYKGGEMLDEIIRIPIVRPEAVISAPYPDSKINVGASNFSAYPFFFNAGGLNYFDVEWSAMGQKSDISDNPWQLNLNIDQRAPKDTEINLSVLIRNFLEEMEFARRDLKLFIK